MQGDVCSRAHEKFNAYNIFDDLSCSTRVKHGTLKISQNGLTMAKKSKIYGLYILNGFYNIPTKPPN